jgi:nitrous oxidase accessory protein NosD
MRGKEHRAARLRRQGLTATCLAVTLVLALGGTGPAQAATVRTEPFGEQLRLVFEAAPDEANQVVVSTDAGEFTITDTATLTSPNCAVTGGTARCGAAGVVAIRITARTRRL